MPCRESNPRPLDRKSDALPQRHDANYIKTYRFLIQSKRMCCKAMRLLLNELTSALSRPVVHPGLKTLCVRESLMFFDIQTLCLLKITRDNNELTRQHAWIKVSVNFDRSQQSHCAMCYHYAITFVSRPCTRSENVELNVECAESWDTCK